MKADHEQSAAEVKRLFDPRSLRFLLQTRIARSGQRTELGDSLSKLLSRPRGSNPEPVVYKIARGAAPTGKDAHSLRFMRAERQGTAPCGTDVAVNVAVKAAIKTRCPSVACGIRSDLVAKAFVGSHRIALHDRAR